MKSYEQIEKEAMRKLLAVVQEFRQIYPRMELNQLLVFLHVALDDGVETLAVKKMTGLLQQVLSRNVHALSPLSYLKNNEGKPLEGLGLIVQTASPSDGRAKRLHLTFDGHQLVDRLTKILMNLEKEHGT